MTQYISKQLPHVSLIPKQMKTNSRTKKDIRLLLKSSVNKQLESYQNDKNDQASVNHTLPENLTVGCVTAVESD